MSYSKVLHSKHCWLTRGDEDNLRIAKAYASIAHATEALEFLNLPVLEIIGTENLPSEVAPDLVIIFSRSAVQQIKPSMAASWKRHGARIIAIGRSTANALVRYFSSVEVPELASSEGVIEYLKKHPPKPTDRVLLAQGIRGRDLVREYLTALGVSVKTWRCYRREPIVWSNQLLKKVELFAPAFVVCASVEQWHAAQHALDYLYLRTGQRPLILVVSERIAQAVRQDGWQAVTTNDPTPSAIAKKLADLVAEYTK